MKQPTLWVLSPITSDVVYTPIEVAADIVDWCKPFGPCLDPCAGDFAFYDALPSPKDWCEITRGRDFFDFQGVVDWIVGNPPYSIFDDWLSYSFACARNVVYLLPTNKVFQTLDRIRAIDEYGGIKGIRLYGSGQNIGLPFGFSVAAFHFAKDWKGDTRIDYYDQLHQRPPA